MPGRIVRFGRFDLDLKTRELHRDGLRVRLQDQPFRVLALLLERPGDVVTREELRERLWVGDTFVDFERGLNNAVRRLREALGDSAEVPRFIDTIPRVGYRFVGLVDGADSRPINVSAEPPPIAAPRRRWVLLTVGVLVVAAAGSVTLSWYRDQAPPGLRYITYSGHDWGPAASPDGQLIAFTSDRDGRRRIWLTQLANGEETPVTSGPSDTDVRFSPDGASLLFTRVDAGVETLYRVAVSGGEPRRLLERATNGDWSPDGRHLAYTWLAHGERPAYVLGVARADGGEPKELALVEATWMSPPRWSPDGRWIAAANVQGSARNWSALVVDAANGEQRRLQPAGRPLSMSVPAWSSDGRDLFYVQSESGQGYQSGRLVRQHFPGGETHTLLPLLASGRGLDTAGRGSIIVDAIVGRQNLREHALRETAAEPPRWLTRGFSEDRQPVYSHGGGRLVFASNRGGDLNLWEVSIGAGTLRRLTRDPAEDRDPRVMPNGRILWTSNRTGEFEVWIAEADGSSPRQVTHGGTHAQHPVDAQDAQHPVSAPDASWILYTNDSPDRRGLWRIRPDGSEATPLVPGNVRLADVSPDGQLLLLSESRPPQTIIRVARLDDVKLVAFEIVLRDTRTSPDSHENAEHTACGRWMPDGQTVAFVEVDEFGRSGVSIQDFTPGHDSSTSRRKLVGFTPDTEVECFAVSPDGQRLTVAVKEVSRHLMMIDGLRNVGREVRLR